MIDEERQLWRIGAIECRMISCCTGAELQLRRDDAIVLRELYPTRSDLYERAQELEVQVSCYDRQGSGDAPAEP